MTTDEDRFHRAWDNAAAARQEIEPDSPSGEMPVAELRQIALRFVDLNNQYTDLKAELRDVTDRRKGVMEALVTAMIDAGFSSIRVEGATIFLWETLRARALEEKSVVCAGLHEAGLDEFVSEGFNLNTISAWLREQPRDEAGNPILPPPLVGKIGNVKITEARCTTTGGRTS